MKKKPPSKQQEEFLGTLKVRFENHMSRHQGVEWIQVQARLEAAPQEKLWSLFQMEDTGGEPDVTGVDSRTGEAIFQDCSEHTPPGRVSLCYDDEALHSRKEHKPKDSAVGMAKAMGIELLTEEEYRQKALELGEDPGGLPQAGRSSLGRAQLQARVYRVQWRRILLRRPRIQGHAEGLKNRMVRSKSGNAYRCPRQEADVIEIRQASAESFRLRRDPRSISQ